MRGLWLSFTLTDHRQSPCQPCSCKPAFPVQGTCIVQHLWARGLSTSLFPPKKLISQELRSLVGAFNLPKQLVLVLLHVITVFPEGLQTWGLQLQPQPPGAVTPVNEVVPVMALSEVTRIAYISALPCQDHLLLVLETKWKATVNTVPQETGDSPTLAELE